EAGSALAALAGAITAALLYYRRNRKRAPMSIMLGVGGMLAIAAVVVGLFTQQLWQTMANPVITLSIAAVGTLLVPLAIFPLMAQVAGESSMRGFAGRITSTHVAIAAVVMLIAAGAAFSVPVQARSNVKLVETKLPSLTISLPAEWEV